MASIKKYIKSSFLPESWGYFIFNSFPVSSLFVVKIGWMLNSIKKSFRLLIMDVVLSTTKGLLFVKSLICVYFLSLIEMSDSSILIFSLNSFTKPMLSSIIFFMYS